MIRFACPQCHKPLQVADNAAGKRLKCPQCGGVLNVPAPAPAPNAALPKAAPLAKPAPQASAAASPGAAARKGPAKLPPPKLLDAEVVPVSNAPTGPAYSWPKLVDADVGPFGAHPCAENDHRCCCP